MRSNLVTAENVDIHYNVRSTQAKKANDSL